MKPVDLTGQRQQEEGQHRDGQTVLTKRPSHSGTSTAPSWTSSTRAKGSRGIISKGGHRGHLGLGNSQGARYVFDGRRGSQPWRESAVSCLTDVHDRAVRADDTFRTRPSLAPEARERTGARRVDGQNRHSRAEGAGAQK